MAFECAIITSQVMHECIGPTKGMSFRKSGSL